MDATLAFPDNTWTHPANHLVLWMPRLFREIQLDMDRASARLELSRDQTERRGLLKELKRLVLESQLLTNAPPLELHSRALLAAGVVGEPDKLALAVLALLYAGRSPTATPEWKLRLMETRRRNSGAAARVLIVEDFPAFRRFIRSTLAKRPGLQVVAEVSDGLEAVQKAAEQRPDLILLDIGLPTMNGIEAARQIRKLSPESKIVFLSQESSGAIVEEALSTGAYGYVVKANCATQLLAILDTVNSAHGERSLA